MESEEITMETGVDMVLARAELHTIDDLLAQAWGRVSAKLNTQYGDAIYRSWLKPIQFSGSDGSKLFLSVPTRFMREWINSHYITQITQLWQSEQVAEG